MPWLPDHTVDIIKSKFWPHLKLTGRNHKSAVNKILLHTTEGRTYPRSTYVARSGRSSGIHPHLTWDWYTRTRYQHVSTDFASYALKGGDQDGVIQVELVGFANESHTWTEEQNAWIGTGLSLIMAAHPQIPASYDHSFLGSSDGVLARPYPYGKARISPEEWARTTGIVGHQHVPWDDHWDPGRINIDQILEHTITPGGDMPYVRVTADGRSKVVLPGENVVAYVDDPEHWIEVCRQANQKGVFFSFQIAALEEKFEEVIVIPSGGSSQPGVDEDSIATKAASKTIAAIKKLRFGSL